LIQLQQRLGHQFTNQQLLLQALTHRSCGPVNNERMEFIGDALLGQITGIYLFEQFPTMPEGNLSRVRAALVCEKTLVTIGDRLGVTQCMRVDCQTPFAVSARPEPSMIADALEAIFGAVYLDAGIAAVTKVVRKLLVEVINSREVNFKQDPKTELQELMQGRGIALPIYGLVGSSHRDAGTGAVTASCRIPALNISTNGHGSTKKMAEADAAAKAIAQCRRP
jgi:ribonuclease-3